jgi:hypothetical protein
MSGSIDVSVVQDAGIEPDSNQNGAGYCADKPSWSPQMFHSVHSLAASVGGLFLGAPLVASPRGEKKSRFSLRHSIDPLVKSGTGSLRTPWPLLKISCGPFRFLDRLYELICRTDAAALPATNQSARIVNVRVRFEIKGWVAADGALRHTNHLDHLFPSHGVRPPQIAASSSFYASASAILSRRSSSSSFFPSPFGRYSVN